MSQPPSNPASFSTVEEALAHVRERLRQGDPSISFRLPVGGADVRQRIIDALDVGSGYCSAEVCSSPGLITVTPKYGEEMQLLAALRNPSALAALDPTQRRALRIAQQVVSAALKHSSEYERALVMHDFLVRHTAYVSGGASKDRASCVTNVLTTGTGVCEGYTRTYRLLLTWAGISSLFVSGDAGGPHCWNLVKLHGRWVHIDCTFDDPVPDTPDRVLHSYFGMSDDLISATHTWDRSSVPAAPSPSLYYPFRYGWHFATMQDFIAHCLSHTMPKWYITVYIDELGRPGADATDLLDAAHRRAGRQVVSVYALTPGLPCAFSCLLC